MSRVSVVIITLNEGDSLRATVENMAATLPPQSEIIVVDDGSTDGSADFLNDGFDGAGHDVALLRSHGRLGVAGARNYGAGHAHGDVLVFSDAHVMAPQDWCEALLELVAKPEVGIAAPAISMMGQAASAGYGQKWSDASLAVEWLGCKGSAPYAVPLICGCFLAMRREVFAETGGFDAGLALWGAEDSEISIRLWTLGYECWIAPHVEVQHAFRPKFPYEVNWEPVLHNRLRLASLHFGPERLTRVLQRLKQYDEFARASARLLAGDLGDFRAKVRSARRFDDDWFFDRFPSELKSDLSIAGGGKKQNADKVLRPVTRPVPRESVSACLINWKRPENLPIIVKALRSLECIDEIIIWNNNPVVPLEIHDDKTRVIQSDKNLNCYGRFVCAAQARNQVIYVQDDDALNGDIPGLYRQYLDHPEGVAHALAPTHWGERRRLVYADCEAALIGWGAFFNKDWLSVLEELPVEVREDPLFQREADKIFTLLLKRKHTAVPGDITHLDGHSTPGVALWLDPRRQQHASLAIRSALRMLRLKNDPSARLPWAVVIPCHNYGRFLGEAIESILANDADYEIQIVDDASTDDTPEVAARYVERYPHIHYLRNAVRRGVGYSRNRGIAALDSEFVVMLDADDRIGPGYLFAAGQRLAKGADVVNPDAVVFGVRQDRWVVPETATLEMLLERNPVHCSSAFRRELWTRVGGIDEEMECWMDYEFWIRLAAEGARIQGLHGDHFFYRTHNGSLSESAARIKNELRQYLRQKHANLYERFSLASR